MGEDTPLTIGNDVVGNLRQAETGEEGIVPHPLVADVTPRGVAIHHLPTLLGVGIQTNADYLQLVHAFLLLQPFQLALDVLALVVPGRPGGDDIDFRIEIAIGDGLTLDVGGGELWQRAAIADGIQSFQMLDEGGDAPVAGTGLADGLCQGERLLVVGRLRLDEVFVEQEDAGQRGGVLRDELGGFLDGFRRCHLTDLHAEARHQFVFLGATHLNLFQVGGVALDVYLGAGGSQDGYLGIVGEDEYEGGCGVEGYLVGEAPALHADGVEFTETAIGAVDIELTLVEALEFAFYTEESTIGAAGDE